MDKFIITGGKGELNSLLNRDTILIDTNIK